MKFVTGNIFYQTIQNLNRILLPNHKQKAVLVFVMVVLSGMLEVLGLAFILPVISVALDKSIIHSNKYLQTIYSTFNFSSDNTFLLFLLASLLLIFIIKNTISVLISYQQARYSYKISLEIGRLQFIRYFLKDLQFFNENNSNILYQNIRSISSWLSSFVLLPLLGFFSELTVVIIVVAGMALYDATIFLMIAVTLVPVFMLIYRFIKNKIQRLELAKAAYEVEVNKTLYQTLDGYVDVKLFNKDTFFITTYLGLQEKLNNKHSIGIALQSLPTKIIEITAILGVIGIITYSIIGEQGRNFIPLLSVYVVAAYRLMPSLNRMLLALMNIKGYQYLFEVLKNVQEESSIENIQQKDSISFEEQIQIDNICYTYPGALQPTLQNISFTVKKGERIGFIGQSGAGKTTLINILLRFLKEDKGSIIIDENLTLLEENKNVWRDLIGYVKQSVFIIDGDFYENIAFGVERKKVDEQKLKLAIKSSRLDEVVKRLPKGLHTNIGENGTKLSGGQRQRIAIARALYKDAQILIFDEATSALDNETEKEITEAINSLSSENKTMFIIAHRISTLKNCDRIIELEHGRIIRECRYEELNVGIK